MKGGKNCEGYSDPTANIAIARVYAEEKRSDREEADQEAEYKIKIMTKAMKAMARGFGFEITNRVEFLDKKTGREYK